MKCSAAVLCAILWLEIFFTWSPTADAKTFMRCELAKELLQKYQFDKTLLSNWICLVEHESNLNTSKVTRKENGSVNYGLFQISSKEWCRTDRKAGRCNKKCDAFADDNIADDVECAKQIFNTHGFKYWSGWNQYCYRNSNLPNLELLCKLNNL